ncbi:hypothetical protein SO694_00057170 [Aureococcus anophagefferens]|uniref:U2A'/phosphoprotein 32 family A C-terminal domain-containing protein n=1 Tax=Aureococcus anophagefferens TaxID=44056 RepID=A0ABR1FXF5_AURAN
MAAPRPSSAAASRELTLGLICRTLGVEDVDAILNLRALHLDGLRIDRVGNLEAFAGTLKELHLQRNRIASVDDEALAGLAPSLAVLNLSRNGLREAPDLSAFSALARWRATSARPTTSTGPAPPRPCSRPSATRARAARRAAADGGERRPRRAGPGHRARLRGPGQVRGRRRRRARRDPRDATAARAARALRARARARGRDRAASGARAADAARGTARATHAALARARRSFADDVRARSGARTGPTHGASRRPRGAPSPRPFPEAKAAAAAATRDARDLADEYDAAPARHDVTRFDDLPDAGSDFSDSDDDVGAKGGR